jgi:hypothetical protein
VPSPSSAPSSTFLYADHEGALALVHAYRTTAADEVRFLSVGGAAEVVKAVLIGLRLTGQLTLIQRTHEIDPRRPSRQLVCSLRLSDKKSPDHLPTRQLIRRLPCGAAHGILYPDPAPADPPDPSRFALILPEAQRPNAASLLLRSIDRRTTLPLHASWNTWLWRTFDEEGSLEPLQGTGPWIGWDVAWSEATLHNHLTDAIKAHRLSAA